MKRGANNKSLMTIVTLILVLILVLTLGPSRLIPAQTGTATIGGNIYSGANDGTGPVYAPSPLVMPITNAKVMVQDMEHGGRFITYGTVTGNTWTATVPAPGEYVVMFSAPGYDATSRAFEVEPGDNVTKDAYLPPMPLPKANLLVYAFEDMAVNGEDDYPDDPPLKGVTFRLLDEEGNVVATGVSGSSPTLPPGAGPHPDGLYYFTGLEPGEYYVEADPSTVPGWTNGWHHTTSEEGSQRWEVVLYPGDPGTEAGVYLIWFGFVKRLGQIPNAVVPTVDPNAGSIEGYLLDADGQDPEDVIPPDRPCVSPNDAVPDGFVVLYTDGEGVPPHPVATALCDPVTGYYRFDNVPPGRYKIFASDVPIDYVWVPRQVRVAPGANVTGQDIWLPRFYARTQGYVRDLASGLPLAGVTVHMRLKDGGVWKETTTDANGWYNFDDLEEVEVIGFVDIEPPVGYRLADVAPDPMDPDACTAKLGKKGNHYVQFYSGLNYRADLYVEPIPATEGDIAGFVFNDNLEPPNWTPDGIWQDEEEATIHGVRVELWDATNTTLLAVDSTGKFNKADVLAQGWVEPYTYPPDEFGGVFNGKILGYYEFKGLAPGTYNVKVIPLAGFSPTTPATFTITLAGGTRERVDFGLATQVPLAGEIEGGVFDDINLDTNPLSLLFGEKAGIPGVPVGIYDHLGYLLDVGYMGNPLCYTGSTVCPPGEPLGQKPEMERRAAPGPHIYYGNDPSQPGYNPNYVPLALTYTFGQKRYKFEADWSLVPVAFMGLGGPLLANGQIIPNNAPVINNVINLADLFLKQPNGPMYGDARGVLGERLQPAMSDVLAQVGLQVGAAMLMSPISPMPLAGPTVDMGDVFRIQGQNFGEDQGYSTVTLNGYELEVKEWTDTYIDVKIPKKLKKKHLKKKPRKAAAAVSGSILVATSTGISNAYMIEVSSSSKVKKFMAKRAVFVDANYTGPSNGSKDHPYKTINDALNNLPSKKPRYVFVAPGEYNEQIHITEDDIYLIGAGPRETTINGLITPVSITSQGFNNGSGPVIHIGDGEHGGVDNIWITGFTITGGTVNDDDIGAGIFLDYENDDVHINDCIIVRNGGYYGGGIWGHKSNEDITIHSCIIAENGNYGGYGGGISFNDEPEYDEDEEHGEPEHTLDDHDTSTPAGEYEIYNNLIFHNFSPDYGGGLCLYEVKAKEIEIYGNLFIENKADDHGGAIFFEDTRGEHEIFGNIFLRNYCPDDGGAISFEDVADDKAEIRIYNNLFAENIADDRGENHARGGALAFDDTFNAYVYNNTIVGNIVAGSYDPAGGGIDSERNGHEYNGEEGPYIAPGYSDPKIYNNIIWNNWRLKYDQPIENGEEEDLDYTWGKNYRWYPDEMHVDNPHLQPEWESDNNSESFTVVHFNDIRGGYSNGTNNMDVDPMFVDPANLNWRLQAGSPVIDKAIEKYAPKHDLENLERSESHDRVDMGAFEWRVSPGIVIRIPTGILGAIQVPVPGSTSLSSGGSSSP